MRITAVRDIVAPIASNIANAYIDFSAMTASVDLAMGKARSAALFKKPTQDLEDAINHGR